MCFHIKQCAKGKEMKATLEFNLPEDADAHLTALNGVKYLLAAQELDNYLRNEIKYNDALHENYASAFDLVRTKLRELFEEYGVELYD
jgi:hypothetical protein